MERNQRVVNYNGGEIVASFNFEGANDDKGYIYFLVEKVFVNGICIRGSASFELTLNGLRQGQYTRLRRWPSNAELSYDLKAYKTIMETLREVALGYFCDKEFTKEAKIHSLRLLAVSAEEKRVQLLAEAYKKEQEVKDLLAQLELEVLRQ